MFDLLHNKGITGERIRPYLEDNCYYSEDESFRKVIKNETSYPEKLRFFAFYTYLAKGWTGSDLIAWSRVIYNLTENTIINTADEFYKALFAINELSQYETPILETLKGECELSGFTGAQILEEEIKAHLMLKSSVWTDVILSVEKHPFFNGQIGFVFNFSGILEFYREHEHCEWSEELDNQYFKSFNKYADSASAIFNLIRISSAKIDYLWERAVLSKGKYFTQKSGGRFNLLSTRETKNNIPRDHSWKRLLRIGSSKTSKYELKQAYVKAVLDDPTFNAEDIKESLESICTHALQDSKIEDWRKALINHKELISYCNQGFISISEAEVILLSESQRNHYHGELHTKVLEFELIKKLNQVEPFTKVSYKDVKSRDERAGVIIADWPFANKDLTWFNRFTHPS